MLTNKQTEQILQTADLIYSADAIERAVQRMAEEISKQLSGQYPLVLCVMKGSIVFTGHLLPKLSFPLNFDYLRITRYHNKTSGGNINWQDLPCHELQGRVVLIIDDILDEGVTLAEIRKKVLDCGARSFYSAVLANKDIGRAKPLQADFVGLSLPNRYVFGFGMDIHGAWRNLPAIYATDTKLERK